MFLRMSVFSDSCAYRNMLEERIFTTLFFAVLFLKKNSEGNLRLRLGSLNE